MKYYVYAQIERTSYDTGSLMLEFDTRSEALACKNEIAHILDRYETLEELATAIANQEYKIAVIGSWTYKEALTRYENAEEWVYNTYSDMITYEGEYLRDTVNRLLVIGGTEVVDRDKVFYKVR